MPIFSVVYHGSNDLCQALAALILESLCIEFTQMGPVCLMTFQIFLISLST